MSKIKLGFFRKKVELDNLKPEIKREQLKKAKDIAIFDKIDKNKDGKLSVEEVQDYVEKLKNAAGADNKLNRKEARNGDLGAVKRGDIYRFLNHAMALAPQSDEAPVPTPVNEPSNEVKPAPIASAPQEPAAETPEVPPVSAPPVEEETPEDYKHKLQAGDTWYGIVEAKYGTKNPQQIRAIIKEIKKLNPNVDLMTARTGTEIVLPSKITLSDGQEFNLTEDAAVDTRHFGIKKDETVAESPSGIGQDAVSEDAPVKRGPSPESVGIAKSMCKIIDEKSFAIDSPEFQKELAKVDKDNILDIVKAYKSNDISPDESLFEAIYDENNRSSVKKAAVQVIFDKLAEKAKEAGVDDSRIAEFKSNAEKELNSTFYVSTSKLDYIANSFIQAIENKMQVTPEAREKIKNTPAQDLNIETNNLLRNVADSASTSFINEQDRGGWAAAAADGISRLWGSDNTAEKVSADLNTFRNNVKELEKAHNNGFKYDANDGYTYDNTQYNKKFKEIYGVNYDAELVHVYEKNQNAFVQTTANYQIEQSFNNGLKNLLANDTLGETGSKQQSYENELNNFASYIGGNDIAQGKATINEALQNMGINPDTATVDEKYAKLHELAKNYSKILHNNTLKSSGGKSYEECKADYENSYAAAFGTKNDIMKRVSDYNTSQQMGEAVVKGAAKAAGAILLASTGVGLVGVAVGTAATSATIDTTDRISSNVGLQDGEITDILKNATIDGATVFVGGQITKNLAGLKNISSFTKMGGQITGDIVTGAAAEKLQTGEISIQGVAFQCVFSAAGNLVSLKQLSKSANEVNPVTPEILSHPRVSKGIKGDVNNNRDMIADAAVARNSNQQHLNANERRMIEESLADVPTEAELQRYMKEHAYQPPTPEERVAIDANNSQAAAAHAKAHEIGENLTPEQIAKIKGEVPAASVTPKPEINIQNKINLEKQINNLEKQIINAKKMPQTEGRKANIAKMEKQLNNLKERYNTEFNTPEVVQTPEVETSAAEVAETPARGVSETPENAAKKPINAESEEHYPNSEEKMAMAQIGNNINRAKTLADLDAAQKWLNRMPECEQKRILLNKLNEKTQSFLYNRRDAYSDYRNAQENTVLPAGERAAVSADAKLNLGGKYELDLNSLEIKSRINALKDGESFTVGRDADFIIPESETSVSRKHLIVEKQGDKILITDISTNGTKLAAKNAIHSVSPIEVSNNFANTSKVGTDTKIPDGYRDGGRNRTFDLNGNISRPGREIILVDRSKDVKLQNLINEVKNKTKKMNSQKKARYLQEYIAKIGGKQNVVAKHCDLWEKGMKGKEVMLGDIFAQNPPVAVCRHRSLLYKILGDEIGLKTELQRGNWWYAKGIDGGGHAWNVVKFDDGTSAIFDAMHNKSYNITPGKVDSGAKRYFDVNDLELY